MAAAPEHDDERAVWNTALTTNSPANAMPASQSEKRLAPRSGPAVGKRRRCISLPTSVCSNSLDDHGHEPSVPVRAAARSRPVASWPSSSTTPCASKFSRSAAPARPWSASADRSGPAPSLGRARVMARPRQQRSGRRVCGVVERRRHVHISSSSESGISAFMEKRRAVLSELVSIPQVWLARAWSI